MIAPKCTSMWGHKFEPRYSTTGAAPVSIDDLGVQSISELSLHELTKLKQAKTYEGDVCVRCGCVVNRKPA